MTNRKTWIHLRLNPGLQSLLSSCYLSYLNSGSLIHWNGCLSYLSSGSLIHWNGYLSSLSSGSLIHWNGYLSCSGDCRRRCYGLSCLADLQYHCCGLVLLQIADNWHWNVAG